MKTLGKALTWDQLAEEYDTFHNGRKARTLPMQDIWNWAESQKSLFKINKEKGTIHKIIN